MNAIFIFICKSDAPLNCPMAAGLAKYMKLGCCKAFAMFQRNRLSLQHHLGSANLRSVHLFAAPDCLHFKCFLISLSLHLSANSDQINSWLQIPRLFLHLNELSETKQ